jgi:hypothetical protein
VRTPAGIEGRCTIFTKKRAQDSKESLKGFRKDTGTGPSRNQIFFSSRQTSTFLSRIAEPHYTMRFYTLPTEDGKTACVNFDHVTNIVIGPKQIEIYVAGQPAPMVIPKSPTILSTIAKGMDLSETAKDQINSL